MWWDVLSYSFEDFLLFSKSIYYDLVAIYNQAIWPLHIVALVVFIVVAIAIWLPRYTEKTRLAFCIVFAVSLSFIAKVYFLDYFTTINWSARYFAYGFFIQSALMVFQAFVLTYKKQSVSLKANAVPWLLFVIIGAPVIAWLFHSRLAIVPIVGIDPNATMLALIAAILVLKWSRWLLMLPSCWLLISGLMRYSF